MLCNQCDSIPGLQERPSRRENNVQMIVFQHIGFSCHGKRQEIQQRIEKLNMLFSAGEKYVLYDSS